MDRLKLALLLVAVPALIFGVVLLVKRVRAPKGDEIAALDVAGGAAEHPLSLRAGDTLVTYLDVRAAKEIQSGAFGDALATAGMSQSLVREPGRPQESSCAASSGWIREPHRNERLKRPLWEGVENQCSLRADADGLYTLRVKLSWQGLDPAKATLRVFRTGAK